MILTSKQQEGLRTAVERYRAGEQWTCISGYAGTGKSTLVRFIIEALQIPNEDVAYVAYTGKAANVLKQKGCPNATTAHKLLYFAKPMPNGNYIFTPKPKRMIHYKIIVVDEISMLPIKMWTLLLSYGIYILATGDPGQLPPINPEDTNNVLNRPHVFLNEIMRQAKESEIIRLSMHIRKGEPLSAFKDQGEQVQIISPQQVVTGMWDWADQILCATNAQRNNLNRMVREYRGFSEAPCAQDKIISLRNHWDYMSDNCNPLTNGSIGNIECYSKQTLYIPKYITGLTSYDILISTITTEDGDTFSGVPIDYKALTTGEKTFTSQQEYKMLKNRNCPEPPYEFAYGYAITVHKAQGSEWNKVLVYEDRFPFGHEEHKRWLYTACTRASEKLVIVRS